MTLLIERNTHVRPKSLRYKCTLILNSFEQSLADAHIQPRRLNIYAICVAVCDM